MRYVSELMKSAGRLLDTAPLPLAELDVLSALAEAAAFGQLRPPEVQEVNGLNIRDGRIRWLNKCCTVNATCQRYHLRTSEAIRVHHGS